MTFETIMDTRVVEALGWALLHFVWQGALAALVFAATDVVVPRRSARARYVLALAALAAMAALPVFTFASALQGTAAWAPRASAGLPVAVADASVPRSIADAALAGGLRDRLAAGLPMLVAAWGLGVALLSVRVIGGWTLAQRLARSGRPAACEALLRALPRLRAAMGVSRPVRLLESARVQIPTVVGWMRPVILFPAATLAGLTPAQLEVVLAHELAHVRRLDYLVNLLQTAVETLLFYHPAVWWVSHRARVEREHCCDDAAVAACGDALAYARALTDLEGLRLGAAGLAMAADGGSLLHRVGRLVGGAPGHAPRASRALGGLLALAVVPLFLGGPAWMDARAQTVDPAADAGKRPTAVEASAAAVEAPAAGAEGRTATSAAAAEPAAKPASKDTPLPLEQVLELARAGVTPEYLDEMAAAGYPSLSWRELIELREQGVTPEYVRGLASEGYSGLAPERLIELRSQGVDPDFVKGLRAQGLQKLSLSDLVELRSQGVDPDFVRDLKAEGYSDLSTSALINLRSEGVSPEYVRKLKELGYTGVSPTKLVALRSEGVTPEFVSELKDLGYSALSLPVLIGLRSEGVTPEYVRELKALGYADLPTGLLVELRSQGVTPEFIREVKDAGFGNASPQDLIELRSQGVGGDLLRRLRRQSGAQARPPGR